MIDKQFKKEAFKESVKENVKFLYRKTLEEATQEQIFQAVSYTVKDVIIDNWLATQQTFDKEDPKMVYYMSMEFLMGRALGNNLINLTAYKEVKEALEKRFNLDKPVGEQFVLYMKNLAHGDFGVSAKTGRDIKTTIFESFKVSAKLGGMAILTALVLGLIFGSLAALTRNHLPDRLIIFFSTLFTSLPSFVFASLLLLVFCVTLKWVPES